MGYYYYYYYYYHESKYVRYDTVLLSCKHAPLVKTHVRGPDRPTTQINLLGFPLLNMAGWVGEQWERGMRLRYDMML